MGKLKPFKDMMVMRDDLIIVNDGEIKHRDHHKVGDRCCAPQGRLFEVLGVKDGRRVVREIDHNTVVVGGGITAIQNLTGTKASWQPATLNDFYGVAAAPTGMPTLALFGIGTGGSNLDFGSVIAPDIKQRDILGPIPLRYGPSIAGDDKDRYFMKVPNKDAMDSYSWYLKEFAAPISIKSCWKNAVDEDEDGTEILSDIHNSTNTEGIETFAEISVAMNIFDGREYYESVGALSMAKFNTLGFYTGSKTADGGEYANVSLYSLITFNNKDLTMKSTREFLYRIYSLI